MSNPKTREVYGFTRFVSDKGENVRSQRKATPEAIKQAKGVIIEGTREIVDASLVDDNGFYPRKP